MAIYTDAKGNLIHVKDKIGMPPPSSPPTKTLMSTVTHAPPHKAAAMVTTNELVSGEDRDSKPTLANDPPNVPVDSFVTPTSELPPPTSADIVVQEAAPSPTSSTTSAQNPTDKKRQMGGLSFSATIQTVSTMPPPSASSSMSPRLTPRLSIDLSSIPPVSSTPFKRPARRSSKTASPVAGVRNAVLAYNQYGEIVKIKDMGKPKDSASYTVVETLRLIDKAYGYDFRARMTQVIELQMEERTYPAQTTDKPMPPPIRSLSSWDYTDFPMSPCIDTPEQQTTMVYSGPPRVLEIGCGNGSWCFASKDRHPEWIIEGLDDQDHWSEGRPDLIFRDFTTPPGNGSPQPMDYFRGFQLSQEHPEFTVRNLNAVLAHSEPIPHNLYGLIRGRAVFDRVESYKEFLEDVRLILQPDGVVEFVELDPRPREDFLNERGDGDVAKMDLDDHASGPVINWTDSIADRFRDPETEELSTSVPGWTERVKERLKAGLRPKDGVAASQLKSWLEGAGFWDVKEMVFRLQIGGESRGGKLLEEVIKLRIEMEDEIPLLAKELPKVEPDAISFGFYYLNLHIVTGRKPKYPRPGDLLLDGSRQEMTSSKYDAMAKLNDAKSNQWKRFDLDGKLTSMMKALGAAEVAGQHVIGSEGSTSVPGSPPRKLGKLMLAAKGEVSEAGSVGSVGTEK